MAFSTSFYSSLAQSLLILALGRLYPRQKPKHEDLSGKTAIVTGANSGIGASIAVALAKQGATVYLACRNPAKFDDAIANVVSKAGAACKDRVFCRQLDVGDMDSVRSFAPTWELEGRRKIDILVHNAGIASVPAGSGDQKHSPSEIIYRTNFLGSFLLTHLLEQYFSATARVIFTSSTGHYGGKFSIPVTMETEPEDVSGPLSTVIKDPVASQTPRKSRSNMPDSMEASYSQTKAQQVLFAKLLQTYFAASAFPERSAHAFTPGFTSSPIFGKMGFGWKVWLQSPFFAFLQLTELFLAVDTDEGATTGWWLASTQEKIEGGGYWERMTRRTSLADVLPRVVMENEWKAWEKDADIIWDTPVIPVQS